MTRSIPTASTILAAALLAAAPAAGQGAGSADLARRTFQNAEQLMREGKRDQALKDYQQVFQAFPESPLADDALMRVGSYHYPPETIAELGSVPVAGQDAAQPFFEQVRERYAQSDSAPHALYKIGLMRLEPDSPKRNLDDAYASFNRVVNIYPGSPWVAGALLGAATAEVEKRNYDRAILSLERGLEESPHGPSSAESQYALGLANVRLGDFVRAAEAFQACRMEDEKSGTAERALDWLTLVHNMRLRAASGGASVHAHDPGFVVSLPAGEDLRGEIGIAVGPGGEVLAADPRRGALLTFGKDGARLGSEPLEGARRVAVDAFDRIVLASATRIRVAGADFPAARKVGSQVRRIEEPGGVWRASDKGVWVLDVKEGELLRYGADPSDPKVVHRDKDAGTRVEAMAGGPEDRIYLLDGRGKSVLVIENRAARPLFQPGAGAVLEDPVDVAADALGDVYVLDARARAVVVFGPDGKRLARISSPAGSAGELLQPSSLAVGPGGEVYVYDERKRGILRFR